MKPTTKPGGSLKNGRITDYFQRKQSNELSEMIKGINATPKKSFFDKSLPKTPKMQFKDVISDEESKKRLSKPKPEIAAVEAAKRTNHAMVFTISSSDDDAEVKTVAQSNRVDVASSDSESPFLQHLTKNTLQSPAIVAQIENDTSPNKLSRLNLSLSCVFAPVEELLVEAKPGIIHDLNSERMDLDIIMSSINPMLFTLKPSPITPHVAIEEYNETTSNSTLFSLDTPTQALTTSHSDTTLSDIQRINPIELVLPPQKKRVALPPKAPPKLSLSLLPDYTPLRKKRIISDADLPDTSTPLSLYKQPAPESRQRGKRVDYTLPPLDPMQDPKIIEQQSATESKVLEKQRVSKKRRMVFSFDSILGDLKKGMDREAYFEKGGSEESAGSDDEEGKGDLRECTVGGMVGHLENGDAIKGILTEEKGARKRESFTMFLDYRTVDRTGLDFTCHGKLKDYADNNVNLARLLRMANGHVIFLHKISDVDSIRYLMTRAMYDSDIEIGRLCYQICIQLVSSAKLSGDEWVSILMICDINRFGSCESMHYSSASDASQPSIALIDSQPWMELLSRTIRLQALVCVKSLNTEKNSELLVLLLLYTSDSQLSHVHDSIVGSIHIILSSFDFQDPVQSWPLFQAIMQVYRHSSEDLFAIMLNTLTTENARLKTSGDALTDHIRMFAYWFFVCSQDANFDSKDSPCIHYSLARVASILKSSTGFTYNTDLDYQTLATLTRILALSITLDTNASDYATHKPALKEISSTLRRLCKRIPDGRQVCLIRTGAKHDLHCCAALIEEVCGFGQKIDVIENVFKR